MDEDDLGFGILPWLQKRVGWWFFPEPFGSVSSRDVSHCAVRTSMRKCSHNSFSNFHLDENKPWKQTDADARGADSRSFSVAF